MIRKSLLFFIAALLIALFTPIAQNAQQRALTISNPSMTTETRAYQQRRNTGMFFNKIRSSRALTVAYIGGSITAGAGASNPEKTSYRALVTDWLKKSYPKAEITEINASIAGTGSPYATLRARRDVISLKPDLVFVEFAVSDSSEEENAVRKGIEGLVRQLLVLPQPPEVVMIYATTPKRSSRAELHDQIAAHYSVPAVNLQDQVWKMIDSGSEKSVEIWKDGANLTDAGHKLYADRIIAFLTEQSNLPASPLIRTLPQPLFSDEMNYGEFKAIAEIRHDSVWKIEPSNDRKFPSSLLTADKSGAVIEYYFEGTVLGITFKTGPDCGMFETLIDGKPAPAPLDKVDCYEKTAGLGTRIIAGGLGLGEHKLTIRILDEKNSKSSKTAVRLGYLLIGGARPEKL